MEDKTAILFAGSGYNLQYSLESLLKNLVEPNNADVFVLIPRNEKRRKTPASEIRNDVDTPEGWASFDAKTRTTIVDDSPLRDDELAYIRQVFGDRLKVLQVADDLPDYMQYIDLERIKMMNTINSYIRECKAKNLPLPLNGIEIHDPTTGYIRMTIDQYRHIRKCYQLFEEYERKTGTKYKYVMRARIDFVCDEPILIEHYTLNHDESYLYSMGSFRRDPFEWADEFCWFSKRDIAARLFPALDRMGIITTRAYNTVDNTGNDTIFSPECQFSLLLRELNLPVINVKIFRSSMYSPGNDGFDYFNYKFRRDKPIDLDYEYKLVCECKTDINEHCPVIYKYAMECDSICELGQRFGNSTIAFLKAAKDNKSKFISYDPQTNPKCDYIVKIAQENNIDYTFIQGLPTTEDHKQSIIEDVDFLFIDTNHNFESISEDVTLHSPKCRKYMAFHDVKRDHPLTFWHKGQGYESGHGMKLFMEPFLENNKHIWKVVYWTDENNGLLILERIGY